MDNIPIFDAESGYFISAEHQRIAELINDYDPNLFLVWVPPSDRNSETSHPFGIIHRTPNGDYWVRKVKESELNAELIAWLWTNDNERNNTLAYLEKIEQANEALKLKKQMEELEAQKDIALTILKSPLHTFRHNGKVYS